MKTDDLKKRTKKFAHDCVKLAMQLPETALGKHIRAQLIRSSTSVAANYRAAILAQSKSAFIAKLSIVLEESDESHFWLEFILEEKLMSEYALTHLLQEAHELTSIFFSSRKTLRMQM